MTRIRHLHALEILDSRGRPTVAVTCELTDGARGCAQVPSGASTGRAEAVELRDGDETRYAGLGCQKACANVTGPILASLTADKFENQQQLDDALIALDGTPNKSSMGANATLGVSLAFARATADSRSVPLYEYFAELISAPIQSLPRLTVNLFSGGKHAGGQVPIQDVLVVPAAARSIDESLEHVCAVYRAAADLTRQKYSQRLLRADEGGQAPDFASIDALFADTLAAIDTAILPAGRDIRIAIDVAASHFYGEDGYRLDDRPLRGDEMIQQIDSWVSSYPIVSVEDGLAEDDWEHWPKLRSRLEPRSLVVGDDLLCTNPDRIRRAIECHACNTLLLKVNQIGTLSEAADALRLARAAGWRVTISARSGETEDDWLADLAVGWSADQIKVGSITQSERLAKYNRLLAIEHETQLPVVGWPN